TGAWCERVDTVCYSSSSPGFGASGKRKCYSPESMVEKPEKVVGMDTQKKIKVEDLRLAYGGIEVIHNISFEVFRNEILAIIDPAHCRRTSHLRSINRTVDFIKDTPVSVKIFMDNEDIIRTKDVFARRRRIGMVAPLPVGPPLTICENV